MIDEAGIETGRHRVLDARRLFGECTLYTVYREIMSSSVFSRRTAGKIFEFRDLRTIQGGQPIQALFQYFLGDTVGNAEVVFHTKSLAGNDGHVGLH